MKGLWVPADALENASYDAAKPGRRRIQTRQRKGSEDCVTRCRSQLVAESLDAMRNSPLVGAIIGNAIDLVLGKEGLKFKPDTSDPEWNRQAQEFIQERSKKVDVRERYTMREFQRLCLIHRMFEGELFINRVESGLLQPIEGCRICTPKPKKRKGKDVEPRDPITDGVQCDRDSGKPIRYWVAQRTKKGLIDREKVNSVEEESMIRWTRDIRFDQERGTGDLWPVLNKIKDLERLDQEIISKAILDALHAWFIKGEGASEFAEGMGDLSRDLESGAKIHEEDTEFGKMLYSNDPSADAKSLASATPNATIIPYMAACVEHVASCLRMSPEGLTRKTSASFSAGRYILKRDHDSAKAMACDLAEVLTPWYHWQIFMGIRDGLLPAAPTRSLPNGVEVSEQHKLRIIGPREIQFDPGKEASAMKEQWNLGCPVLTEKAIDMGLSINEMLAEKGNEIKAAMEVAKDIGGGLTWRDIINAAVPGQLTSVEASAKVASEGADSSSESDGEEASGV